MTRSSRSGFAVATAVFALVVVGALAMGTLFAAGRELRSGTEAILQTRASMAAELGLEQTIAAWRTEWNAIARGYSRVSQLATSEGASVSVRLTRLADELYLVTSEARAGPAKRQVARVVMLDLRDPRLFAAVTADTTVELDGGEELDGTDRSPPGWECAPPGAAIPPVASADTSEIRRFAQFGWDELARAALIRVTASLTGPAPRWSAEECDIADPNNWGEPTRLVGGPCMSYYPLIHAPGNLVIDGGRGQGLLLVDGDLTLRGGFEFFGVVLVRGALRGDAGGARLTGVVAIAAQGSTPSSLDGLSVAFSRCAARKALLGVASPVPIVDRSWYEAFEQP